MPRRFSVLLLLLSAALWGQGRGARYTLILEEPPVAAAAHEAAKSARRFAAADHRRKIESDQAALRGHLRERKVPVIDASQTLLNAVYVVATPEQARDLSSLPGVVRVIEARPMKRHMVKAVELANATAAWSDLGGEANAGAGVRIAILDTGIDHRHRAFQDPSLGSPPPSYPRCRLDGDCDYTSNKILVARSYVDLLVLPEDPRFSRPDDLSPRDRVGHGTATAMVAAGVRHASPLGTVSGVAPKAYLGNYKIFGSPGVNDITFDNVLIRALEDALADGMDIAVLALGSPALWMPSDRGSICGRNATDPCDPRAEAVQNAATAGLLVVASAGNDGDLGVFPTVFNSIHSPGTAPGALTVGASTNGNLYYQTVRATGDGVPDALRQANGLLGDGPRPAGVIRAPARNAASVAEDGFACRPIAQGSLSGRIALVARGNCGFAIKVQNARAAGAIAVIIEQSGNSDFLFPPTGLRQTGIPAMLIGATAGAALRQFAADNPDRPIEIDPATRAVDEPPDFMAYFSSYGPSIENGAIKPEVVAPGLQLYMATQSFDPGGDMYAPNGYTAAQGTSFSAPIAAGAAALFKQRFRSATAPQVKSAVVGTANPEVRFRTSDGDFVESVIGAGAGKVDARGPARTTITTVPSVLSFGYLPTTTAPSIGLTINNHGSASADIRLEVVPVGQAPSARVTLSETSFALGAGQSRQITARLTGSAPGPGIYEGAVVITGGPVEVSVPYLYTVGDGVPDNAVALGGVDFVNTTGSRVLLALKVVDRFGAPVNRAPLRFRSLIGGGAFGVATLATDEIGIGDAEAFLGPLVGQQLFAAEVGGLVIEFPGRARLLPAIQTDGVVNTADGLVGQGVAPGSYISIFGRNLSEALLAASTPWLPYALAGVSVSFDVAGPRSYAGRIHFVSENQINVQVPWELQGLNSAQMKVSIGDNSSALYTVPLNDYSPAVFEFAEPGSGRMLAAALDQNFGLVTTANPVARGRAVQIYVNGLGPVDNRPPSGEPSPAAEPLARTRVLPEVTIGGRPAQVIFSGLAPAFVGLYQVNVIVAADTPTGVQPLVMSIGGRSSKASSLPIN